MLIAHSLGNRAGRYFGAFKIFFLQIKDIYRGWTMTSKVLVFVVKGEGWPGARKTIELSPACLPNGTEGKRRERERGPTHTEEGVGIWLESWEPGEREPCLVLHNQDSLSSVQFELPDAWRREAGGVEDVLCAWAVSAVWLWRHRKLITAPMWCHWGQAGALEEPLTLAGLQERTDLLSDRKGFHLSGLLSSNFG